MHRHPLIRTTATTATTPTTNPTNATAAMRAPINWSLELGVGQLAKAAPLLSQLPAGTRIFIPSLPADPPSGMEAGLATLRRENAGLVPVPHIAASREESDASLERRLCAWQRVNDVREVLVVRGDTVGHGDSPAAMPPMTGPYGTSLDLLETGVLQRCGIETVAFGSHPEGIAAAGLSAAAAKVHLKSKLQWGESVGARGGGGGGQNGANTAATAPRSQLQTTRPARPFHPPQPNTHTPPPTVQPLHRAPCTVHRAPCTDHHFDHTPMRQRTRQSPLAQPKPPVCAPASSHSSASTRRH